MIKNTITLAFETAIWGGSISLMADDREIDFWIGKERVSKAEEILEQTSEILNHNGINKIDLLAVSTGPGSATGIRIGLATAFGLKRAFNCQIVGVPVFEALMLNKKISQPALLAVPVGGRQIVWQVFDKDSTEIKFGNAATFLKLLNSQFFIKIILHRELTHIVSNADEEIEKSRIEILDDRIATLIGLKGKDSAAKRNKEEIGLFASDNIKASYF